MAYSKLHRSLVNSSLWCERGDVRLLFITMLALSDKDGCVYGSRAGILRQANIQDSSGKAFDHLMAEDPDSSDLLRNPENKGRRIKEIEGGFQIVNYPYYRALRNDDDRKIQNRDAQRRHRHKLMSATVSHNKPLSAHAEADAEAKSRSSTTSNDVVNSGEDFVSGLSKDSTYEGIDVRREFGKMANWCTVHNVQPTRRRFVNWLNRVDKPMGDGTKSERQMSAFEIEKRIQAINDEINKIWKRNNGQRKDGDGIDELKQRKIELKKEMLS